MADVEREVASIEMVDIDADEEFKIQVGISYQGSFKLQKNGMIKVKPYRQGTKPNNLKKIVDGEQHAIFESKNLIRVVFTLRKGTSEEMKKRFKEIFFQCYQDLSDLNL